MSNTRIVAVGRLVGRAYSRSRKIKWTMQRTHPKWRQAVREHSVEVIKLSNVPPPAAGRARAPSLSLCERKPKTDEAVTLVRSLARSLSRPPARSVPTWKETFPSSFASSVANVFVKTNVMSRLLALHTQSPFLMHLLPGSSLRVIMYYSYTHTSRSPASQLCSSFPDVAGKRAHLSLVLKYCTSLTTS